MPPEGVESTWERPCLDSREAPPRWLWAGVTSAVLLSACAQLGDGAVAVRSPADGDSHDPVAVVEVATLLLPVAFINLIRPGQVPALMELQVVADSGTVVGFVQAATLPMGGDTAGGADYLFRLTLPPGRYRVSRLSGSGRPGERSVRFAVDVDVPFTVESAGYRYMGRIVAQNVKPLRLARTPTRSRSAQEGGDANSGKHAVDAVGMNGGVIQFNTAWNVDDDLLQYRVALAGVAKEAIVLAPFESMSAASGLGGNDERPSARSFDELNVLRVATTLAPPMLANLKGIDMPMGGERMRIAFERYRTAKSPKAFAISDDGDWGSVSGAAEAATRALVECSRKGHSCRLYAVDDRLVVDRSR